MRISDWSSDVCSSDLTLALFWSTDGTNAAVQSRASTTNLAAMANGAPLWLRYRLDVDNGAGGHTVTFETSENGVTWTPLGSPVVTAGTTSVFAGPAPIAVGAYNDGGSARQIGRAHV